MAGDLNKSDTIWGHRMKAYCLHLMWDEAIRNKNVEQSTVLKKRIEETLTALDAFIKQEQEEDNKKLRKEIQNAQSMRTSIISSMAIREKDFQTVLELYNGEFFENAELEPAIMQRIAGQMCTACYYLDNETTISKDPIKFIEIWQHYARTHKVLLHTKTTTGARLNNSSKAPLVSIGKMHKQSVWFLNNKDQVIEFDSGTMTLVKEESSKLYNQLRDSLGLKTNDMNEQ